jgi:hypothetical protein
MGAATKRWILQQLPSKTVLAHIGAFPNKTPFSHSGYIKSLEFYGIFITLFCLDKPKVVEITIYYKQQLRNNTILSWALFRNAQ